MPPDTCLQMLNIFTIKWGYKLENLNIVLNYMGDKLKELNIHSDGEKKIIQIFPTFSMSKTHL